jgi:hypothetical protein
VGGECKEWKETFRLLYSVNRAQAAAVKHQHGLRGQKTSSVNPIEGPQGVSVRKERRLWLHSVNRARAAAVDNDNIDHEVEKPPARTLSEGRGG